MKNHEPPSRVQSQLGFTNNALTDTQDRRRRAEKGGPVSFTEMMAVKTDCEEKRAKPQVHLGNPPVENPRVRTLEMSLFLRKLLNFHLRTVGSARGSAYM